MRLQAFWASRAARSCSRTTPRSAPARSTRPRSCAASVPSRGASPTSSRRSGPTDGRYGENPYRLQHYFQYQVLLKPSPDDVQDLYLDSLRRSASTRAARHALRRGRLGGPDARRLGPRLGGLARRHGDHPVHLLPAGRRHRPRADPGRAHLRPRAHRDVPAGRATRSTTSSGRRASPTATSTARTSASGRRYNFEVADADVLFASFDEPRGGVPALPGRRAAAAGLRPRAQVLARASTCSTRAARSASPSASATSRRVREPGAARVAPAPTSHSGRRAAEAARELSCLAAVESAARSCPPSACHGPAQAPRAGRRGLAERRLGGGEARASSRRAASPSARRTCRRAGRRAPSSTAGRREACLRRRRRPDARPPRASPAARARRRGPRACATGLRVGRRRRRAAPRWPRLAAELVAALVDGLQLPKTMRWGTRDAALRAADPLARRVLTASDSCPFELHGVSRRRRSRGHRFLGARGRRSARPTTTSRRSSGAGVLVPDHEARRDRSSPALDAAAARRSAPTWSDPGGMLDEVVYLVERPRVIAGRFDRRPPRAARPAFSSRRCSPTSATSRCRRPTARCHPGFLSVVNGDPAAPTTIVRAATRTSSTAASTTRPSRFAPRPRGRLDGIAAPLDASSSTPAPAPWPTTARSGASPASPLAEAAGVDADDAAHAREAARLAKADQGSCWWPSSPSWRATSARSTPAAPAGRGRRPGHRRAVPARGRRLAAARHRAPGAMLALADKLDALVDRASRSARADRLARPLRPAPRGGRPGPRSPSTAAGRRPRRPRPRGRTRCSRPGRRPGLRRRRDGGLVVPSCSTASTRCWRARRASTSCAPPAARPRRPAGARAPGARARGRPGREAFARAHTAFTRAHRLAERAGGVGGSRSSALRTRPSASWPTPSPACVSRSPGRRGRRLRGGAAARAARLGPPVDAFFDAVLVMDEDPHVRANRLALLAARRAPADRSATSPASPADGRVPHPADRDPPDLRLDGRHGRARRPRRPDPVPDPPDHPRPPPPGGHPSTGSGGCSSASPDARRRRLLHPGRSRAAAPDDRALPARGDPLLRPARPGARRAHDRVGRRGRARPRAGPSPSRPDYFKRVAAMEFAVKHDDGLSGEGLARRRSCSSASRARARRRSPCSSATSATRPPTCRWCAGSSRRHALFRIDRAKVVGLTIDPERLARIRGRRLRAIGGRGRDGYADLNRIYEELEEAAAVQRRLGCPVIDVTNLAVEEAAHRVIGLVEERGGRT